MKKMFLLGILIFAFLMAPWTDASAQAPKVINYQAQLVDASTNQPLDGTYTITFALFTEQTGGAAVWSDIKDVQVEKGYMNVYLGDKNPFGGLPFDRAYYLEITVGNGNPYPRTLLSSTPYTMFAVTADTAQHSLSADTAYDVKDGVITFAKLHPSLQIAGGDLEGFYPNPTIKSSALLGLIKPGSITQSMLGPNVTAIPMGPAGGALIGNYPNPWLGDRVVRNENIDLGTITLDRFNVAGRTPGQVAFINAFGELVWGPLPTPLNTIGQGTEQGQMIFWDNVNMRWAISPADAPAAGDVLTWNALTNSFEWAAPSTFSLPFAFTGATNGQTAVSITKTDGPGDGLVIELTDPTAGTALHAHNASATAYAMHTENLGGGPTFHAAGSPVAGATPESYVAHVANTNANGRTMLIEGSGDNPNGTILDPTDTDNATLVVRNTNGGANKTAIKTYGDIYANSRIGATTIIANNNVIIGDPNGVNTTITAPATAGDPIGISGNAHVAGNLHIAGELMVDGAVNFDVATIATLNATDINAVNVNGENGAFNALTVANDANFGANIIASGDVSAATFTGNGAALTNLDATALTTGTIDVARLSGTYDIDISGTAAYANSLLLPYESGAIDAGAWLMNLENSADASVGSESGVMNLVNSNSGNTSPVLRLSHANANGTALLIDGGRIVSNSGFDITANTASAGGSYLLNLQQTGTGPGISLQSFNSANSDVMLYVENASSTTGRGARFYNSDENNTGYALSVENAGSGQGLWVLGGSTAVSVGDVDAVVGGETDLTEMNRFTVIRVADNGGATTINEANLPSTATVVDGTLLYIVNDSGSDIASDLGNITNGQVATYVRVAGAWRKIN